MKSLHQTPYLLPTLSASLLLIVSCGSAADVDDTFRAECEVACAASAAAEAGGCDVPPNCVPDCIAVTSGLETLCGKCVADNTDVDNIGGTCIGFAGEVTSCSACVPGAQAERPDFEPECEAACRATAALEAGGCEVPSNCVADCVAVTSGLETLCGKCVAANTDIDNVDGTCVAFPGSLEACDSVCQ